MQILAENSNCPMSLDVGFEMIIVTHTNNMEAVNNCRKYSALVFWCLARSLQTAVTIPRYFVLRPAHHYDIYFHYLFSP